MSLVINGLAPGWIESESRVMSPQVHHPSVIARPSFEMTLNELFHPPLFSLSPQSRQAIQAPLAQLRPKFRVSRPDTKLNVN